MGGLLFDYIMTPKLEELVNDEIPTTKSQESNYKTQIVWKNVIFFIYMHLVLLHGLYLVFYETKFVTFVWLLIFNHITGLSITAGAHRLWTHRCYKAKWPLRLILMILQNFTFQDSIYQWARDHRVHHKYTDTDADPYNSTRGFFFSHMGWLLVRKHPDVKRKGAEIDLSDLKQDPIIVFQKRWYLLLMPLCTFIIPTLMIYWIFDEPLWNAWHLNIGRYCMQLHITWLVNSAAHKWGYKPYNKSMSPTDNALISFLVVGEGWHNYHHVFPWDYKTAELGNYTCNFTTAVIDFCAYLGLAYDLKTVPPHVVKQCIIRNNKTEMNEKSSVYDDKS